MSDVRKLNNWVKAVLINTHVPCDDAGVLDLCCGCGGDLTKFEHRKVSKLVGVDTSAASVQQARIRAAGLSTSSMRTVFMQADLGNTDNVMGAALKTYLAGHFQAVSCQFALHYFFKDMGHLTSLLSIVASSLKPGGAMFGVTANGESVSELGEEAWAMGRKGEGLVLGNDLYRVTFSPAEWKAVSTRREKLKAGKGLGLGLGYRFTLGDRVSDCPEFLTSRDTLEEVAASMNLKLEVWEGLQDFVQKAARHPAHEKLSRVMRAKPNSCSPQAWDVVGLYAVYVLRKI